MNWRRGFKRIALAYVVGAIVATIGAVAWDISQIYCPPDYTVTADEQRDQWWRESFARKRQKLSGKCQWVGGIEAERLRMAESAADRLGLPETVTRPLPVCTPEQLAEGPRPAFVDKTYMRSDAEISECRADLNNWQTTINVVFTVILIPVMLALLVALGFGMFWLGRWLFRGFRD